MGIKTNGICQIAMVVRDIEATVKLYEKMFNLKDLKIDPLPKAKDVPAYFRGKPGDFSGCRICAFKIGDMVLEMVEPDEKPSPWKEFLDTKGKFGVDFNIKQVRENNNEKIAKLLDKPGEPIDSI